MGSLALPCRSLILHNRMYNYLDDSFISFIMNEHRIMWIFKSTRTSAANELTIQAVL